MSIVFEPLSGAPRGSDEKHDLAPLRTFQKTLSLATGLSLAVAAPDGRCLCAFSHPADRIHGYLIEREDLLVRFLDSADGGFRVARGIGNLSFLVHPVLVRGQLYGFVLAGPVWEVPPGRTGVKTLADRLEVPAALVEDAVRVHPAPVPLDIGRGRDLTSSLAEVTAQMVSDRRQQRQTLTTLASLYDIGTAIGSSLDLEEVLRTVLHRSIELFGACAGSVVLLDEVRRELRILAQDGPEDPVSCTTRVPLSEEAAEWVAREGEVRIGDGGAMSVPLKAKDRCLGVIKLAGRSDWTVYTDHDLQVLGILAGHAASAIDNAQLYSRVSRQVQELEALQQVGQAVNSSLDLKATLQKVLDHACEILGAPVASVMLLEPDGKHLTIRLARGLSADVVSKTKVRLGERISGRVAQQGEAIMLPRGVDENGAEHAAALCVPLKVDNKVVGVLNVRARQDTEEFTREDLDLAARLASISATALENAELHDELQHLLLDSITALANSIDARDPYTRGHSDRVTEYSVLLAERLGFTFDELERLRLAALLHDIGKIRIPDHILNKPGRLTDDEFDEMKRHPVYGVGIMLPVRAFRPLLPYMLHHHERFDGLGYPDRKQGNEIPLPARIICVADCFDAMTSDRPYRKGMPVEIAIEELRKGQGTQFDPECVDAFLELVQEGKLDTVLEKMRAQASVSSLLVRRNGAAGGAGSGLVGRGRLAGLPSLRSC